MKFTSAQKHQSIVSTINKGADVATRGITLNQQDIAAAEAMLTRASRREEYHTRALELHSEMATLGQQLDSLTEEYADVLN